MERFDEIRARYAPIRTDDLRPGSGPFVGRSAVWCAAWIIEEGPYAGQWAMTPVEVGWPFAWAPGCDLVPDEDA